YSLLDAGAPIPRLDELLGVPRGAGAGNVDAAGGGLSAAGQTLFGTDRLEAPGRRRGDHCECAGSSTHLAEGVGFEPTEGCPSPVFKTGAFNRSATLPERSPVASGAGMVAG